MIDHVSIGVKDLARAGRFYDACSRLCPTPASTPAI